MLVACIYAVVDLQDATAARSAVAGFDADTAFVEAMACEKANRKPVLYVHEHASLLSL